MLENTEVAFLGGVFSEDNIKAIQLNSIGNIQYAANKLQWNLISGVESCIERPITLLNQQFIGSYPRRYRKPFIKTTFFSHSSGARDINIGFCNITCIKQLLLHKVTRKFLSQWAENHHLNKALIVYSSNFADEIIYIKKKFPEIHLCLVLPDLPVFMNMGNKSFIYKAFNYKLQKKLSCALNYTDSIVFLTKHMRSKLNIRDSMKFTIIEGIADSNLDTETIEEDDKLLIVTYTGTLTLKYGIEILIEAFSLIKNPRYRLIICGAGEGESLVHKASQRDFRIDFRGLQTPREVTRIQMTSTILVNPRQNNEEYTKYSFPSKTMEYMSSGKPVLCYKLDGIPDDYDPYLFYVKDNSIETLAKQIIELCETSSSRLKQIGEKNRRFVTQYKSPKAQASKIIDMISGE